MLEEIYTPWRHSYVVSDKDAGGCVLCDVRDDTENHRYVLARDEAAYVVLNIYPYALGHLMVVAQKHVGRSTDLEESDWLAMSRWAGQASRALRLEFGTERVHQGVNLGRAAGAGVAGHIHLHLVPYFEASGPIAKTRPDELDTVYERLLPWFRNGGDTRGAAS